MDADLVLRWMSETGAGSARDLRQRLAWLAGLTDAAAHQSATGRWLRDMSALGHAETGWATDKWAVNRPVVIRLPAADGTAVLAGSRRTGFLERLEDTDVVVHRATANRTPGDLPVPTIILLQFDSISTLRDAACTLGAQYAGCAATSLAAQLPRLSLGQPAAPPSSNNDTLKRLTDAEHGAFQHSTGEVDGVYQVRLAGRRTHLYRRGGSWFRCDLPTGIFTEHALHGRSVMRWRAESGPGRAEVGTVFVDWGSPLPPLHARALSLCSGFPAHFSSTARTSIFVNVPHAVATAVASSLSQTLQAT